ncbi:hypothetical protein PoB_006231200 [Plakobranchus ocellatus]|uniref:Uncharacterized protein n=1 Tax=Plakobranchus ocellatus TaxID=259542 RepID=A0AAV4CV73_9GAST|nr:hypothetical protein PoB_006231200 [Plakobranchus ocellatus]
MLRNCDNTVLFGHSLVRLQTRIKNKNRLVCAEFYVLPPLCSAIIGQNLISVLGPQIDGFTMEIRAVTHHSVDIAHEYPCLLSNELGTFPDYQHGFCSSMTLCRQQRNFALSLSRDARKFLKSSRTWMTLGFGKLRTSLLRFIIR